MLVCASIGQKSGFMKSGLALDGKELSLIILMFAITWAELRFRRSDCPRSV